VLVIILIVVALMGALAFTFTRNSGGAKPLLTEGQSKIAANQILKYAKSVENAVKQLQLINQCSESEISFENTTVSGYTNATAPSDNSCHVFDINGGGLAYQTFEKFTPYVAFSKGNNISGTGNDDIVFHLIDIDKTLCKTLNDTVNGPTQGNGNVYTETGSQRNLKFNGFYPTAWTYNLSGFTGTLPSKFCIIQRCYASSPCPNQNMYSFTYQIHER
ncbi:MAG: hypothetical protein JKY11_01710, partial [Alphaproteobacteria bacterium]|nr:hypothetical protein [Alphaproteobacteria bacterium]